ncbi:MAG: hypothetical protein V4850_10940 [Myxococcota bacterium]
MSPSDEVERFITTGEHDPRFSAWEGSVVERRKVGAATLRDVLRRIVGYRAAHGPGRRVPVDVPAQVAARVAPMVRGLVPTHADALLALLPTRVHVVTPTTFGALIEGVPPRTAWDLANLVLDDIGAPPLADDTPELDGLSHAGHAWLLPRAFTEARPFSDVVVHEVAHLLHGIARREIAWEPAGALILAVPPRRRETFAYACEVWSCVTRDASSPTQRRAQLLAFRATSTPADARVDRRRLDALLDAADGPGAWGAIAGWATG